jgi:4-amino-4-deoxy-L-arabinose transferase-like glycosyltransferase
VNLPDHALPASAWTRLREAADSHRLLLETGVVAAAALILLVSVLPNLANHPTLTDDEAWVMSASYKLAKEGVFGSDMFRGFFNADRHYLFNMPGHHFVVASVFKTLGAGVAQARLAAVAYGLASLGLTYLFARRLYGVTAAVLALGLLLFLRLNMGFDTGLPLQELASNVRYDLAPVPFMLGGTLLLLSAAPKTPGPNAPGWPAAAGESPTLRPWFWRAVAAGALFGAATLLQFYGAFMIPVAVAFLALESLPARARAKLIAGLIGAAALTCLPWRSCWPTSTTSAARPAPSTSGRLLEAVVLYRQSGARADRFCGPGFKEVPKGADPRLSSLAS